MMRLGAFLLTLVTMASCATYHSPARETWGTYLRGASMTDMTEMSRVAKRPVYLGAGGHLVTATENTAADYGDKIANDNAAALNYMARLEYALYDALRMPGISVQRAGTDVMIIMVRDALMELDVADISAAGDAALNTIARILREYDATFIEIAGYTDAMRDPAAARTLSLDMAKRVAVYLAQHKINTARMFIVGRGSTRPIAAQDDIGRLTNRRVEIRLAPAR
ncbi:MAG: OmpA family protein [Alphaproteobacteria bacterium]|nr:OmpA family protein [Alphaproteobacteria bacterium]MDE6571231.1 OmpA family protein [Alphaproteobacteria bacterium]